MTDLEPSSRSHAITGLLQPFIFLSSGSIQHTVVYLFLYSVFATMLICTALGILLVDM